MRARVPKSATLEIGGSGCADGFSTLLLGAALRTQLHLRTVSPILEIGFCCDRRKPEQLFAAAAGALSVERPSLTSADQQARKHACDHDVICNETTAAMMTAHAGLPSCQDRFTPMVPR